MGVENMYLTICVSATVLIVFKSENIHKKIETEIRLLIKKSK